MLAKLTKKVETQEQKSASSSSCSDEALGQKEVRWSHHVGNGPDRIFYQHFKFSFFVSVACCGEIWASFDEDHPAGSGESAAEDDGRHSEWGDPHVSRVHIRSYYSHWTLLEEHLQNSDSCFGMLFRLKSRLREEGEELFKLKHRFQLLEVNLTFLCAMNLLRLLK